MADYSTRDHVHNCSLRHLGQWGRRICPQEAARRRVTSPPPLQTVCDANPAEMDFLKSAVASAISKGPAFGYTFGDRVDLNDSIWTLHNGTKRVWPECLHAPRQCQLTLVC
jgi:hypothetical protein